MGEEEVIELFEYEEKASRIELFVRIFYAIPVFIVLFLYSLIASICLSIQWLVILILGKRNKELNNIVKGYTQYYIHLIGYFSYLTDERPGVTPRKVQFFEAIEEE